MFTKLVIGDKNITSTSNTTMFCPVTHSNPGLLMITSEDFSCHMVRHGSELLISIYGALDTYTVDMLQEGISVHLGPGIDRITIDCDRVKYVDSAFLQLLTRLSFQVASIRIINASRTVRKIFEITCLDSRFIVDD